MSTIAARWKRANAKHFDAREKRIAVAPVWQRRNGWELVRDGVEYVVRDPGTREEVYANWKLKRVREVADESKPS